VISGNSVCYLLFALPVMLLSDHSWGAIGHRRLVETAENSVIAMSILVTLTVFSLWYQLLSNNFNLQFVAQNSSRAMPGITSLEHFGVGKKGRWSSGAGFYAFTPL
jgi:cytochrome c biogenesis factor